MTFVPSCRPVVASAALTNAGKGAIRSVRWSGTNRVAIATLLVPDHLTDLIAPFPALVSAAEATTGLQLGTNVINNDLRHPVLVAREAAAVDLLTDGRLQLGLGAGSIRSEYDEAGMRFDAGRIRVERLA